MQEAKHDTQIYRVTEVYKENLTKAESLNPSLYKYKDDKNLENILFYSWFQSILVLELVYQVSVKVLELVVKLIFALKK